MCDTKSLLLSVLELLASPVGLEMGVNESWSYLTARVVGLLL